MVRWSGSPKKITLIDNGAGPQSRNGETAVFALGPKSQNGPKIHFSNYGVLSVSNKPALTVHRPRAGLDNLLYQLKFFFSFKLIEVIKETNLMHWLKRNQNGPMWLKYDPKCHKMAQNGPRRSKMTQNDIKRKKKITQDDRRGIRKRIRKNYPR